MYEVHKFMALGPAEVTYFVTQVGLAASSFGVADSDVAAVGAALVSLFGKRCSPAVEVVPPQGPALQAICVEPECPIADDAVCGLYDDVVEPGNATMTGGNGTMSMTTTGTGGAVTMTMTTTDASGSVMTVTSTGSGPSATVSTAGAAAKGLSLLAVAAGVAALLL